MDVAGYPARKKFEKKKKNFFEKERAKPRDLTGHVV